VLVALVIAVALPLSFACFMTTHVGIVLALRRRRIFYWRSLWTLIPPLAPLAPYWALKERMYIRASAWGLSLLAYVGLLAAAYI
jgi:hypothetical protein